MLPGDVDVVRGERALEPRWGVTIYTRLIKRPLLKEVIACKHPRRHLTFVKAPHPQMAADGQWLDREEG